MIEIRIEFKGVRWSGFGNWPGVTLEVLRQEKKPANLKKIKLSHKRKFLSQGLDKAKCLLLGDTVLLVNGHRVNFQAIRD